STTKITTSASRTALSAWAETSLSRERPPICHPPVSTSVNSRPAHSASSVLRSRVPPGLSSTIVSRRPTIRLTSVDLPTLGRPTTATTGRPDLISALPLGPVPGWSVLMMNLSLDQDQVRGGGGGGGQGQA